MVQFTLDDCAVTTTLIFLCLISISVESRNKSEDKKNNKYSCNFSVLNGILQLVIGNLQCDCVFGLIE